MQLVGSALDKTINYVLGVTDVIDASIAYTEPGDRWSLTVGGANITNERYLTTGQAQIAGGLIYGTYNRPAE